jgi:hypothetical protein
LENVPKEELDYWEIHYIQECNSISPNGYNLDSGGNKDKLRNKETKKIISEKSRNISEETRKKMSDAKRGKHLTEEHKRKIGEASVRNGNKPPVMFGNKFNLGRILSEEHKKKIGEANKGKHSGALGTHHTKEWKEKMSKLKKGKPQNKFTCPICGTIGGNTMFRWHFDNCRRK